MSKEDTKLRMEGFTLVELVVVVALFSITAFLVANLFLGQNSLYQYYTAEIGTGRSERLALDRIVSITRQAESILSSRTFSGTTYTTDSQTLILRLKTVNPSNDFVPATFDYIVWYRDAGNPRKLVETIEADSQSRLLSTARVLADNITGLSFTYDNASVSLAREVTVSLAANESFKNSSSTIESVASAKLPN